MVLSLPNPRGIGNKVGMDALRTQLARRQALLDAGARHVGWKVGADIPEVGEPVFGYLTSASVGSLCLAGVREPRLEAELLIEVGAGVGVAIELVDVARPAGGADEIVAANVFHVGAVLGRERVPCVPAGACARMLGRVCVVRVDVADVVERIGRLLAECGECLRSGDLILGGSVIHVPAVAGPVRAAIDGVGVVDAVVTASRPLTRESSRGERGGRCGW